jgi:hypothetical protein
MHSIKVLPKVRSPCAAALHTKPPSALVADAWVEQRVAKIDQVIDEHENHGEDEQDALDHGVILADDDIHRETPDAGNREDCLGDHHAADEQRDASPTVVTIGITAFLSAWTSRILGVVRPFARAVGV